MYYIYICLSTSRKNEPPKLFSFIRQTSPPKPIIDGSQSVSQSVQRGFHQSRSVDRSIANQRCIHPSEFRLPLELSARSLLSLQDSSAFLPREMRSSYRSGYAPLLGLLAHACERAAVAYYACSFFLSFHPTFFCAMISLSYEIMKMPTALVHYWTD